MALSVLNYGILTPSSNGEVITICGFCLSLITGMGTLGCLLPGPAGQVKEQEEDNMQQQEMNDFATDDCDDDESKVRGRILDMSVWLK